MAIAAFPFFSHSFRVALWIERAVPQLVTCSNDCALPLRREQGGRPPSHSELSGFCAGTVPAFMSVPGKSCHAQRCRDRTPVLHSARLLAVEIRCLVSSLVILFPRCFILLRICACEMCSSKHALLKRLFQVSRHPQALYSFKDVLGRMSAFLIYRDCSGHHSPCLLCTDVLFSIPGSALALKVLCCISRPGRARVCFFLGKKGNNFAKLFLGEELHFCADRAAPSSPCDSRGSFPFCSPSSWPGSSCDGVAPCVHEPRNAASCCRASRCWLFCFSPQQQ